MTTVHNLQRESGVEDWKRTFVHETRYSYKREVQYYRPPSRSNRLQMLEFDLILKKELRYRGAFLCPSSRAPTCFFSVRDGHSKLDINHTSQRKTSTPDPHYRNISKFSWLSKAVQGCGVSIKPLLSDHTGGFRGDTASSYIFQ
jgi:hypothetical protein